MEIGPRCRVESLVRGRLSPCQWLPEQGRQVATGSSPHAAAAAAAAAAIVDGVTQCVVPAHCRWITERVGFKRAARVALAAVALPAVGEERVEDGGEALSVPVALAADEVQ